MSLIPPMLRRGMTKDKGVGGRKAEVSLAARLGGKTQPGSGALVGAKGDVHLTDFLLENKTSQSESFSIKREILKKISGEALRAYKKPGLSFQFINSDGQSKKDDRWVCLRECDFQELLADARGEK